MGASDMIAWAQSRKGMAAAREYLSGLQRMDNMIALRLARLDQIRSRSRRVTRALEDHPRSGNAGDLMADAVAQTVDAENELLQDYSHLMALQREMQEIIRTIPDDYQRMVTELRYLQGISFVAIARRLNYDERQIYRYHEKALRHVALQLAVSGKITI